MPTSGNIAPSCPVSFGQAVPGSPLFRRGSPYTRPGNLVDLINQIPHAHDLPSVIRALNIISHVLTEITRNGPQSNNVRPTREPDQTIKGQDNNPHYIQADWLVEQRSYEEQKLINPDDPSQIIPIKTLSSVTFVNPNDSSTLQYHSPWR